MKLIFVQKRGGQITNKTISREGRQTQHLDNCFVEFHLKYDDRKTIDSKRNNLKIRTKSKSTLFLTQLVKELRLISRSDNQGKKYHTILPFYCQNQKDPHLLMNIKWRNGLTLLPPVSQKNMTHNLYNQSIVTAIKDGKFTWKKKRDPRKTWIQIFLCILILKYASLNKKRREKCDHEQATTDTSKAKALLYRQQLSLSDYLWNEQSTIFRRQKETKRELRRREQSEQKNVLMIYPLFQPNTNGTAKPLLSSKKNYALFVASFS